MNPFLEKPMKLEKTYLDWRKAFPKAYDKNTVDPYTKVRAILMNGTEYESAWFLHNFARHVTDNDLRRELSAVRKGEQLQQKRIAYLKPRKETILETTIGYEQLAVDLTALLARREKDPYVKSVLDFALLEDFDHLYRYADLLEMDMGIKGERLVGGYTEIMPGRPTIAEHRHPIDDVRRPLNKDSSLESKLHSAIITAAEQQTMNYYNNIGAFYKNDMGRKLYMEIAMVEEQHVSQYESLMDSSATWLECWLMHEYVECYLYYSMMEDEVDPYIKRIYAEHLNHEIAHLHRASAMLKKYEKKEWSDVISGGDFPAPLLFTGSAQHNKDYVRKVLKTTVGNTASLEDFVPVSSLPENSTFFRYNHQVNKDEKNVPSHKVIGAFTQEFGMDYRYQEAEHPVKELRDRKTDNTTIARTKEK